jgi:hypothetical protein
VGDDRGGQDGGVCQISVIPIAQLPRMRATKLGEGGEVVIIYRIDKGQLFTAFSIDSGISFTYKKKFSMLKMNNSSIKIFFVFSHCFHIAF